MEHGEDLVQRTRKLTMNHGSEDENNRANHNRTAQFSDLLFQEFASSHNGSSTNQSNEDHVQWLGSKWKAPPLIVILLFILTLAARFFEDWAHIHFLGGDTDRPKGEPYFFKIWIKSILIVGFLQLLLRKMWSSFRARLRNAQSRIFSLWPLMLLHLVINAVFAFDFMKNINNAAGSEFYQVNIVLNLLVLAAGIHISSYMRIPSHTHIALIVISGLQLMILAQDDYFHMPFTSSLYTIAVVASVSCYMVLLLAELRKESILQLVYYLNVCLVVLLPVAIALHDSFPSLANGSLTFEDLFFSFIQIAILAFLTVLQMTVSFLFIKVADPLACTLAWNVEWVCHTLLMALVYKKIYHVSSFKISWFITIQMPIVFGPYLMEHI